MRLLVVLLALLVLAAGAVWFLYFHGADMQKRLRDGEKDIKKRASWNSQPAGEPKAAEEPQPGREPASAPRPPKTSKPAYTVAKPPPVAKARHVVGKDETLYRIAETYYEDGRLWKLIAEANGLRDEKDLQAGMILIIPGR